VLLALPELPEIEHLNHALAALYQYHDGLRTRFLQVADGSWQAEVLPPGDFPERLSFHDVSSLPPAAQDAEMERICEQIQASFSLDQPPLLGAGLFRLGDARGGRLFLAAHHLIIDTVSWRILLDDLALALGQIRLGLPPAFLGKTVSFRRWALSLEAMARSPEILDSLPYWMASSDADSLPVTNADGNDSRGGAARLAVLLDSEKMQSLTRNASQLLGIPVETMLVGALAWALREWAGPRTFTIEMEHHGREGEFDLSRTVGWFTAAFPLMLDLRDTRSAGNALRIANKRLRDLPGNGVPFGLLATYHPDPAVRDRLTRMAATQISFNYHGKLDPETGSGSDGTGAPRICPAPEKHGPERDPASPPARQLEVTCAIIGGALRTEFAYLPAVYNHDVIRRLADSFTGALHEFLSLENLPAAERFSLTGIADVEMDGQEWQSLITELGVEGPELDESE